MPPRPHPRGPRRGRRTQLPRQLTFASSTGWPEASPRRSRPAKGSPLAMRTSMEPPPPSGTAAEVLRAKEDAGESPGHGLSEPPWSPFAREAQAAVRVRVPRWWDLVVLLLLAHGCGGPGEAIRACQRFVAGFHPGQWHRRDAAGSVIEPVGTCASSGRGHRGALLVCYLGLPRAVLRGLTAHGGWHRRRRWEDAESEARCHQAVPGEDGAPERRGAHARGDAFPSHISVEELRWNRRLLTDLGPRAVPRERTSPQSRWGGPDGSPTSGQVSDRRRT